MDLADSWYTRTGGSSGRSSRSGGSFRSAIPEMLRGPPPRPSPAPAEEAPKAKRRGKAAEASVVVHKAGGLMAMRAKRGAAE